MQGQSQMRSPPPVEHFCRAGSRSRRRSASLDRLAYDSFGRLSAFEQRLAIEGLAVSRARGRRHDRDGIEAEIGIQADGEGRQPLDVFLQVTGKAVPAHLLQLFEQ